MQDRLPKHLPSTDEEKPFQGSYHSPDDWRNFQVKWHDYIDTYLSYNEPIIISGARWPWFLAGVLKTILINALVAFIWR